MESGINNKIKVVWICHFSTKEIQVKLNIRKKIAEFAPWIEYGIKEAQKNTSIELHVVSPHSWISGNKTFVSEGIYYHFFNHGIPIYGDSWPSFFRLDSMTNFYFNRRKIKKIINEINPYIIHLHGTENAYFVSSFLDLYQKFPSLITIQGFINLQIGKKPTRVQKQRAVIEKKILQIGTNFGIRTYDMEKFILQYNKSANLFWHEYFINYLHNHVDENLNENVKKFDIIFFAKLTKLKGIEDLILTVAKLKPIFPELKVAIIGGAKSDYLSFLKKLVTENNCEDNIQFYGKLSTQEEVFKILRKAKVSVLPTYVDVIPGTIIESMFHRTAVVSYKTGGLPEINAEQENILLVDIGDINELCNKVKSLLLNEQFRKEMEEKAYRYAKRRWNNEKSFNDIVSIYRKILEWRN